jgi:hypothetical protein
MTLTSNDLRAPDLQGVVLWPGPSGAWAVPPTGAAVRVRYVAASPGMPEVVSLDPYNYPTSVTIGGVIGEAAAARAGDPLQLGGAITGSVSGTTCTITAVQFAAALPTIKSGSTKVVIGG